jgi:mycobactin lysine-N-oxygenase
LTTLAVVGAGPKGIAVAAKARALREAGLHAPHVVLIDRTGVAASWNGANGYTDGRLLLGTPAEKDIGYPNADNWGSSSSRVNDAMARFSWQRYLIDRGLYADWVDHGGPRPTHEQWSKYVAHAARRAEVDPITAEVSALDVSGGRWQIELQGQRTVEADGLVLTGGGPPISLPVQPAEHVRIRNGRDYWLTGREVLESLKPSSVCVIGSGESAAAIVVDILERTDNGASVDVLTSRGVLYSRGESYSENRLYSDPSQWPQLAESHRREFLERTDRGVVSQQAEATLNSARGFSTLAGRAIGISASEHQLVVEIEYDTQRELVAYDFVIVAIGFNGRWFEAILAENARQLLESALGGRELESAIGVDLAVEELAPALHLPVLAGLAQGPGFPNLSCLGLLSDRVLRRYVPLEDRQQLDSKERQHV